MAVEQAVTTWTARMTAWTHMRAKASGTRPSYTEGPDSRVIIEQPGDASLQCGALKNNN